MFVAQAHRLQPGVKFVRFVFPRAHHELEWFECILFQHAETDCPWNSSRLAGRMLFPRLADATEPEPHYFALAGRDGEGVMRGRLRPDALRIHRFFSPSDDEIVDSIFHEWMAVRRRKEAPGIRFVLGEEQFARVFAMQRVIAQRGMVRL